MVSSKRIVILISGRGSNMQAIVKMAKSRVDMQVVAVFSNKADSAGLVWAKDNGVAIQVIEHKDYSSRQLFDQALMQSIDVYDPDFVILAGFMRVLTADFVNHYLGRLINIHPSLLPSFPGLHTHERALASGAKVHGCTVHFVTPDLDAGPTITQSIVPVLRNDTANILAERVLSLEHVMYPAVVDYLVRGSCFLDEFSQVSWRCDEKMLFVHPLIAEQ